MSSARWNRRWRQRRFPRHLGQDAGPDHLQHARHRGQDRRPHRQHVGRQMFDPAGIDDLGADAGKEELADRMLVAVDKRQVGQVDFVLQAQRADQFEGAAAVGQDAAVRQHHAPGCAAGAGCVDQAGQGGRRDRAASASISSGGEVADQSAQASTRGTASPPGDAISITPPPARAISTRPAGRGHRPGRGLPHLPASGGGGHDRRPRARIAQQMWRGHRQYWWCRLAPARHGSPSARSRRSGIPAGFRRRSAPGRRRNAGCSKMARAGRSHAAELAPGDGVPPAIAIGPQHRLVRPAAGQVRTSSRPGSAMSGRLHASSGVGRLQPALPFPGCPTPTAGFHSPSGTRSGTIRTGTIPWDNPVRKNRAEQKSLCRRPRTKDKPRHDD